jgi:antitoxin component YwqK of YwqJK toxin-antitoxin module
MATRKARPKKYVHYHKDGSVWARGQFTRGKMSGFWVWFRKDGTKLRSGSFENGRQAGKWTTYDKKGKVYKVTVMKPGGKGR